MNKKQAHLEMTQGIINRLSSNSFLLKGWSVVMISAFFALTTSSESKFFILLAYFPLFAFWLLDAYFLWQERLYIALFNKIRQLDEEKIDFSMDTSEVKDTVEPWVKIAVSSTLLLFHGTVFISIIIVMLITLIT